MNARRGSLRSLLFFVFFSTPSFARSVVIGLGPNEAHDKLPELEKVLSERIKEKVQFKVSKDYESLVTMFKDSNVDFAFFTPLNYVKAEREVNAKVLLKSVYDVGEFYYSGLVTLKKSKFHKLADLKKGARIGFVDPNSVSGYLWPAFMLRKIGITIDSKELNFFGTHQRAIEALVEGKVDVVGVWTRPPKVGGGAWELLKVPPQVRVLAMSEPIPNEAFAVRESFYEEHPLVVYKMMEALISLSEDTSLLKTIFGVKKLVTATSRHYDPVRDLEQKFTK